MGRKETTNLGNTTYTFEDGLPFAEAIWDAGGDDDLLDLSNFTTDMIVSLIDRYLFYYSNNNSNWHMEDDR